MKLVVLLLSTSLWALCNARTEITNTESCFGIASKPHMIIGAHIYAATDRGEKVCYFGPQSTDSYISLRVNNLNLGRMGDICPFLKLSSFQTTRSEVSLDDDELSILEGIEVPNDPILLFSADCNNFRTEMGKIFTTKSPGDKIILQYNPVTETAPPDAYDITITSYVQGRSWECPGGYFRCWTDKYKCINEQMECDGQDNCYDNSDEESYKCTGKIGGIKLPLFIIIILIAFIILVCLVMIIVFCVRRQRLAKKDETHAWTDMNMQRGRQHDEDFPEM